MRKVSFKKKDGTTISFQARKKTKNIAPKGTYARYVQDEIGKFIKRGESPTEAMKSVGKQYRRRKK